MAVDYGEHMPTRGEEVRVAVARAVRKLTDLEPGEIKIKVTDVIAPKGDEPEAEQPKNVQMRWNAKRPRGGRTSGGAGASAGGLKLMP